MKIVIIDYGAGNIANVYHALKRAGSEGIVSSDPLVIADADALILPGVGAMGDAMSRLTESGLSESIRDSVEKARSWPASALACRPSTTTPRKAATSKGSASFRATSKKSPLLRGAKSPHGME